MGEWWDVNADSFPIVVTICPEQITEAGIDHYRDSYLAAIARREPMVSIVDTRACAGFMRSESRRHLARFGDETREARHDIVLAIVVLATDVLVRASIRAMHWLARPEQPVYFVATEEEAIARAIAVIHEVGLEAPNEASIAHVRDRLLRAAERVSA